MTRHEPFEIETPDGIVVGSLTRPARPAGRGGAPVIALLPPMLGIASDHGPLLADLAEHLPAKGIAVATWDALPALEAPGTARRAARRGLAVLREQPGLDLGAVALLGAGSAAILAAAVARRDDHLAALVLVDPPSVERLTAEHPDRAGEIEEATPEEDAAFQPRPTLILRAAAAEGPPPTDADAYRAAIERAGGAVLLDHVAGAADLVGSAEVRAAVVARIARFLLRLPDAPTAPRGEAGEEATA